MICDTDVPVEILEKILLDHFQGVDAKLIDHDSQIISTGNGFTSAVIRFLV